jgi:hypothetical protein
VDYLSREAKILFFEKRGVRQEYYTGFLGELNKKLNKDTLKSGCTLLQDHMKIKDQTHLYMGC